MVKILNSSRFIVKIGDKLEYNPDAINWINKYNSGLGRELWPTAEELNNKNPVVAKYAPYIDSRNEKLVELWVKHDDTYTGFSGIVSDKHTDIWCITVDGSCMDNCPYSLFKKRIVN